MGNSITLESLVIAVKILLNSCATDPIPPDDIDTKASFARYSFNKTQFLNELELKFGLKLDLQLLWEYPNLDSFSRYIAEKLGIIEAVSVDLIQHDNLHYQEPIALIGMGCRFPGGVRNISDFWQLLLSGTDPISEVPPSRWDINQYYDEDSNRPGKMNSRFGGFLQDIDCFDAAFFNISPKEAVNMDPQQRLFLEVAYQAIEQAALKPEKLEHSSTGVFVGVSMHDYELLRAKSDQEQDIGAYSNLGAASSAIGARLSYFLGLNGPSFAIDTACSSSMSALYQACMSLRSGDCDLALAGGVNVILDPDPTISYSKAHMLSPDGRCKTFDEKANGYVRSEGCGVVILKPLAKAIADGDTIYAVIKSTLANQDGASNGLTAPNMFAQKQILEDALYCANLKPEDIDFFETHGTGTFIGDPIEVDAINKVYAKGERKHPLYLGALKSQLGHCEAAAGIAGILKTALVLHHQQIPGNLHFHKANPSLKLDEVPCVIPTHTIKLEGSAITYAAVSSYGFTGTNTHVILERAPVATERNTKSNSPKQWPFIISAKTESALKNQIQAYLHFLTETKETLADICYTAAIGRSHFAYRIALLAHSKDALLKQLKASILPLNKVVLSDEIIESQDLKDLVTGHLEGKIIDWFAYYAPYSKVLKKVSIPTYCFDAQHYWMDSKTNPRQEQLPDACYYELIWQKESNLPEIDTPSGLLWVITNDVACDLVGSNKEIRIKKFTNTAAINLNKALPDELSGLVYVAPCLPDEKAMDYQNTYAQDFLALAQGLARKLAKGNTLNLGFNLITQNAQQIMDSDTLGGINSAPMGGMIKALQWEAPELNARWIDADSFANGALSKGLLAKSSPLLALRQDSWYTPTVQQAMLSTLPSVLDTTGLHWITGGTGGLGFELAGYLVGRGVKDLLLSSRKGETSELAATLTRWREQGIAIEVCALDSADEAAVKALLELHKDRLTGIYHLAGVELNSPWTATTPEQLQAVLSPKVGGAEMLSKLIASVNLKQCILFSSIASVLGSNRQLAYVSANQYLDALAAQGRAQGLPITSINWGPWGDVGMMMRQEGNQNLDGLLKTLPAFGALEKVLSNHTSGISIVIPQYLPFMLSFIPQPKPKALGSWLRLVEIEAVHTKRSQLALDLLSLNPELRYERLVELVSHTLQTVLGITHAPSLTTGFFALGLDSLMSVEMGRQLSNSLGIALKPTAGFDYPTINELADYLETTLTEQPKGIAYTRKELAASEPIAIIGMACRFPGGANNLEQFWDNLYQGRDAMSPVPKERFDMDAYYDADTSNKQKTHTKEFGFIDGLDVFDAEFFGISPREALLMDPQQRIVLQTAWHALEHAGINPLSLKGKAVGVFLGIQYSEYASYILAQSKESLGVYQTTGNALSVAAGRIAYTLGTQGPTMSIDTACSSSLVALHEAASALRSGECDLAIVAGVNSIINPNTLVSLSNAEMLSVDGRCKTFDKDANGYGRAEGCGVIIIQAVEEAKAQGAHIYASLKSCCVNQDGASSGLTVPNGVAQANLLRESLVVAGLAPEDIDYIECHGTGTSLGDPIEIGAISEVYAGRNPEHPLIVGTVKTNIGHLESAAGIAGVIKTVLALQNQYIPKHLHFHSLNPHINLDAIPALIPLEGRPWLAHNQQLRRAGVSSFGFSGTNAHLILEEAPWDYVPKAVPLPATAFKKDRYWFPVQDQHNYPSGYNEKSHALLQARIPLIPPRDNTYCFESVINAHYPDFVPHHKIYDYPVIAGAVYLSTALQIAKDTLEWTYCRLHQVEFIEVLVLPKDNALTKMYVYVLPQDNESHYEVSFYSVMGGQELPTLHARLLLSKADALPQLPPLETLASLFPETAEHDAKRHLFQASKLSLSLGQHFHWCDEILVNKEKNALLVAMRLPLFQEQEHYVAYPGLIDSCFQSMLALSDDTTETLVIPFGIQSMIWDLSAPMPASAYVQYQDERVVDYAFYSVDGTPVASIEHFIGREAPKAALERVIAKQVEMPEFYYSESWEPLLFDATNETDAAFNLLGSVPESIILKADTKSQTSLFFVSEHHGIEQVLMQVQHLLDQPLKKNQKCILITQRQAFIPEESTSVALNQAGILGFLKTALLEVPELDCRLLDVGDWSDLPYALTAISNTNTSFLAVRKNKAYQLLMRTMSQSSRQSGLLSLVSGEWQVAIKSRGDFSGLEITSYTAPKVLKEYEVELAVQAVGLNFRDVLN
ncbi:MAG: SDR family NAD(P)-dependent oxidoreductase, partial [Legionellales bacterium]